MNTSPDAPPRRYRSFAEFYPFYLSEHNHRTSRRLHVTGTALLILTAVIAVVTGRYVLLWLLPVSHKHRPL